MAYGDITEEQLRKRIKQLMQRQGVGQQRRSTTGRRRRGDIGDIGDIDPRRLGFGLGRKPQETPETPEWTPPEEPVPEPPPVKEPEDVNTLAGEGLGTSGVTGTSALGEALGHGPVGGGQAGTIAGLNAAANIGFGLSSIGPLVAPNIAKVILDNITNAISQSSMESDVAASLGLMGLDPNSAEGLGLVSEAADVSGQVADIDSSTPIDNPQSEDSMFDDMTPLTQEEMEHSQNLSTILDVMEANQDKGVLGHLGHLGSEIGQGFQALLDNPLDTTIMDEQALMESLGLGQGQGDNVGSGLTGAAADAALGEMGEMGTGSMGVGSGGGVFGGGLSSGNEGDEGDEGFGEEGMGGGGGDGK